MCERKSLAVVSIAGQVGPEDRGAGVGNPHLQGRGRFDDQGVDRLGLRRVASEPNYGAISRVVTSPQRPLVNEFAWIVDLSDLADPAIDGHLSAVVIAVFEVKEYFFSSMV